MLTATLWLLLDLKYNAIHAFYAFRYSEVTDTKDFFNAAKKSRFMVVHFYRPVTPRCQIVDSHLQKLAPQHLETRFVKIDAEKNPFLVERLGIIIMPTIGTRASRSHKSCLNAKLPHNYLA